jgi:hypothetical protein
MFRCLHTILREFLTLKLHVDKTGRFVNVVVTMNY